MDIVGGKKFVEVPGDKMHELPPLLVNAAPHVKRLDRVMSMAADIIDSEEEIVPSEAAPELDMSRRKMDLAINLVDQYLALLSQWQWGDSILEWIRQCETTFDTRAELRNLLKTDVWPHAGRSSFVQLLADKAVNTEGVPLERAVGLRLTFRQPPPIGCFSNQFLFYLNGSVAETAFVTWVKMTPAPICCLPPERFKFEVVNMSLQ